MGIYLKYSYHFRGRTEKEIHNKDTLIVHWIKNRNIFWYSAFQKGASHIPVFILLFIHGMLLYSEEIRWTRLHFPVRYRINEMV